MIFTYVVSYGSQVWIPSTYAFDQIILALHEPNQSAVATHSYLPKKATDPIEWLHLSFLQWTLGVSKYTSNTTIWGDTSCHPMIISLSKKMLTFLGRLQKMDENNSQALVRHALREQEELGLDLFNKLQRLKAGLEHLYKKSFIYPSQVRSGLNTWFEEVWDVERSVFTTK